MAYANKQPSYARAKYSNIHPGAFVEPPKCLSLSDLLKSIFGNGGSVANGSDNGGLCCDANQGCDVGMQVSETSASLNGGGGSVVVLSETPHYGKVWQILQVAAFSNANTFGYHFFLLRPGFDVVRSGASGTFGAGATMPGTIILGRGKADASSRLFVDGSNATAVNAEFGLLDMPENFFLQPQWRIGIKALSGSSIAITQTLRLLYYELDCESSVQQLKPPTCSSVGCGFTYNGPASTAGKG